MNRSILRAGFLVFFALSLPVIVGLTIHAASAASEDCGERTTPPARTSEEALRLKAPQEPKRIIFESHRGARGTDFGVELQDSSAIIEEDFAPDVLISTPRLVHETTKQDFPASLLVARATYSEADRAVNIEICAYLSGSDTFEAGTYVGSVKITDGRFRMDPIQLRIDIKDTAWGWICLSAVLGGLAGALWGGLATVVASWQDGAKTDEEKEAETRARRAAIQRVVVLAALAGVLIGVAYFGFDYLDASSFEATWQTRRDLGLVTFGIGVSSAPVIALADRVWKAHQAKPAGKLATDLVQGAAR